MIGERGREPRWGSGLSWRVCLLRAQSHGSVWLQSADPLAPPAIDPNFLGEDADLDSMVKGFKMTKRLLDAPALKALQTSDVFTAGVESDHDSKKTLRHHLYTVYTPS